MLSLFGVCLIYWANKKIAQATNQLQTNYTSYCLHIIALSSLALIELVSIDDTNLSMFTCGDFVTVLLNSYLCYIVWAQTFLGRLNDYEFVPVSNPDGI